MAEGPIEPEELEFEEGAILVRKAREAVEKSFIHEKAELKDVPRKLWRKGAAFVTIERYTPGEKELRGCIGFVYPIGPLIETVVRAALESAFNDPRFPPMTISEIPMVTFEVSVLSSIRPMPEDPDERLKMIKIGHTGLVAKKGVFSGLLLPQVPVDHGWDEETFFQYTCLKAGLTPDCWRKPDVKFYYFTARIFAEETPGGPVIERVFK